MRAPWNRKVIESKEQTKPDNHISQWYARWKQIQELYPIGHEFQILNHNFIVLKYVNTSLVGEVPALTCLYFDDSKHIRDVVFESSDWEMLINLKMKELPKTTLLMESN